MDRFRQSIEFLRKVDVGALIKYVRLLRKPVFIVGCGRSGTTLMLSLLGAHPSIHSVKKETGIFLHSPISSFRYLDKWWRILKLYHFYLKYEKVEKESLRLCEKTPRHVRFIPRIRKVFQGNARIIHMVRDGRDVVTSYHPGENEFHVPISRWVNDVQFARKQEGNQDFLTVRYEDLVLDFTNTLNRVMKFLAEEVHPDQKDYHNKSSVKRHGAFDNGIVRPIESDSINKWKFDSELEKRAKELEADSDAKDLLLHYGYL